MSSSGGLGYADLLHDEAAPPVMHAQAHRPTPMQGTAVKLKFEATVKGKECSVCLGGDGGPVRLGTSA